jgi:mRNA interferase MazF
MNTLKIGLDTKVTRGQVWLVDLGIGIQSEQALVRPCIIISNDKNNKYSNTIAIVPLTTKNKTKLPVHVDINLNQQKSTALVEQIRTISKLRLIKPMGILDNKTLNKIDEAVKIQLQLKKEFSQDVAFEMLDQVYQMKKIIKKFGRDISLLQLLNYNVRKFKDYCKKYNMAYTVIIDIYNKHSLQIKKAI